ncbi:hypothetical protein VFPPC_05538 [Pochonia chlamydosporia 170]|uniref:Uncharacterized protein n=1 Tax=Pochonia chlamydosporia 170 TaxID=1380566 RepID=A0A179FFV4_METCM|nr:hypothetical protein VFPPC_05538 [Pochonia chlamydosporia 170]OAQ64228.1 hypothetical protein VFPPC_05538 [Pochonia chlamydosporia 170]
MHKAVWMPQAMVWVGDKSDDKPPGRTSYRTVPTLPASLPPVFPLRRIFSLYPNGVYWGGRRWDAMGKGVTATVGVCVDEDGAGAGVDFARSQGDRDQETERERGRMREMGNEDISLELAMGK